ncbi:MAG TPA: hypothetical protein VEC99_14215, partial [Clostridia bacterium]|nr:hypothetical protein [Clostridia bacterium]
MNRSRLKLGAAFVFAALLLTWNPQPLLACAACYGQSDSAMAVGMNWGIFSLLGMILMVLGGVASFFIFLARRSASLSRQGAASTPLADSQQQASSTEEAEDVLPRLDRSSNTGVGKPSALEQRRKHCKPHA